MDINLLLEQIAAIPGPSGYEEPVSKYVAQLFAPFVDDVKIDAMYNVIAHKKGIGPKIMLAAHMDEIALMVSRIEKDGCIRMGQIGGVDSRILPAMQVTVWGREKLFGTIGAKPPHLLTAQERSKNYLREDLFVDVGLPYEEVVKKVAIGDVITFNTPYTKLMNNRIASKTMDDRACVIMLLETAELLMRMKTEADIYFVASAQEEVGCRGARAAAFDIAPDLAIGIDVTHATLPDSRPDTTCDIDSLTSSFGPFTQPKLFSRLKETADNHHIKLQTEIAPSQTGTDTDELQISREGVPSLCLSLPLKYMHTSVELIDTNVLQDGAKLLAHFLSELDASWEDDLWI